MLYKKDRIAVWICILSTTLLSLLEKLTCVTSVSKPGGSQYVTEQFPNPRKNFLLCNRRKPSFICDPDSVLTVKDDDKLDFFAIELHQSTPCLCTRCPNKLGGVQIGVFIKYNLTIQNFPDSEAGMTALAKHIRKKWQLGTCEDDIVVVVSATAKTKSSFDMGVNVQAVLPLNNASGIFKDCIGHFDNGNYLQGLESIINSFRDELQRFQRIAPARTLKKTGLIIGLSIGTAILLGIVILAVAIKCRQIRKRSTPRLPKQNRSYSGFETVPDECKYSLCVDPTDKNEQKSSSSSSDEGIDSDDNEGENGGNRQYDMVTLTVPPRFCNSRGRQLSDVLEDSQEDEEEMAAIKYAMTSAPRNCNQAITEL